MTNLHALVLDTDREMLGFVAEALATFEPGFRVSTSRTLEEATRRITVKAPDVIVFRSDAIPPSEWEGWVRAHDVDPARVLLIGSGELVPRGAVAVVEPVSLPALLSAARSVVARQEYDRPTTDVLPDQHVVQH